jgi:hypothetical protein
MRQMFREIFNRADREKISMADQLQQERRADKKREEERGF